MLELLLQNKDNYKVLERVSNANRNRLNIIISIIRILKANGVIDFIIDKVRKDSRLVNRFNKVKDILILLYSKYESATLFKKDINFKIGKRYRVKDIHSVFTYLMDKHDFNIKMTPAKSVLLLKVLYKVNWTPFGYVIVEKRNIKDRFNEIVNNDTLLK